MTTKKLYLVSLLFAAFFVFHPVSASAKDEWVQVRSKNFYLIGNASEKEIRRVATKLEQFRETFRQIFKTMNMTSSVPTNVIVFKSDSSYRPFKPKRGDGKIDNFVAGYFQPGQDVNYITLSTQGTEAETYGTIFHEYVHFILNTNFGKAEIPSWFNEGLAEYYQTFEIVEDQEVHLGRAQGNHLDLLAHSKLIPLSQFFDSSPKNWVGGHSRSIFYAQSWALIHYLVQTGKAEGLDKFILGTIKNRPAEQAFREAFGIGYADMEKALRKYVEQRTFTYHKLTLKEKLVFDNEMQVSPLTEADSKAYLGDLLYHTHQFDDAEPYLRAALTLQPESSMANTTLGMVKIRQRKYDEAKPFLEKAIRDQKNHLAFFRYAELLSREGRDEFGYVSRFEAATANRIREMLKKAIELNPAFTESYELLAFVNLVNNEGLDDAVQGLQKALKYQPGNMRYAMRIAELYMRQGKLKEAAALADKLAKHSDDDDVRERSERLASDIRERQEILARNEEERKKYGQAAPAYGPATGEPVLVRRQPGEERPTAEQIAKARESAGLRALNESLRQLGEGEKRVIGQITKIDCKGKAIGYLVKSGAETMQLSSKDFQSLAIITFVEDNKSEVGCDANLAAFTAVLTYKPVDPTAAKASSSGELVAIEFVPASFRFVDLKTEPKPPTYVVEETPPPPSVGGSAISAGPPAGFEEQRRATMMKAIAENLRKPTAGEKRVMGYIERSECTSKGIFFYLKSGAQQLKLTNTSPQTTHMRGYTPEIENLQFGCNMKSVDVPAVVVYKENTDAKAKVTGDIVSIEFVPRTFQLDQ